MSSGPAPTPTPLYRPGDKIEFVGVYRVVHSPHRANHFVVLRQGDTFPRCQRCGEAVRFELVLHVTPAPSDALFNSTRVYEIPHPEHYSDDDSKPEPDENDDDFTKAS